MSVDLPWGRVYGLDFEKRWVTARGTGVVCAVWSTFFEPEVLAAKTSPWRLLVPEARRDA